MTRAKYIVLEGIQGGGKTLQVQLLADRLKAAGHAVHVTREPGGSDLAARAIRYITQNPQYPLSTKAEVLLYNASRAQSLEVIRDLRDRGVWVVCDRNYLTTLAIQYYARNDGLKYEEIDAQTAAKRVSSRVIKERFDGLNEAFLERMRRGYLAEAEKRKLPVIDASQSIEVISDCIWDIVTTSSPKRGKKS